MFSEQIEAGAKLLDENFPGWLEKQNLERLDLSDVFSCVVGQAYPDEDYTEVLMELFGISNGNEALDMSMQYGFCIPDGVSYDEYPRLTEEWKQFIQDRRLQKVGG